MTSEATVEQTYAELPTLRTERLLLRPFDLEDAPRVRELAGRREVAETTLHIPHPYPEGAAEQWIATHRPLYRVGEQLSLAITLAGTGELIGAIGLVLQTAHGRGEIGYWVGVPYWGQGYCTEAARAVIHYGFDQLRLHRVYAHHLLRNPASGRVLQKVGMKLEGTLRQHIVKWGVPEDAAIYGVLISER